MKMHTFFLSGKALAIIGGGLAVSGVLLFTTGIFVGVGIESVLAERVAPAAPSRLASATAAESTSVSGTAASDPSAWPFGPPDATVGTPVDSVPPAVKADTAKPKPAGKPAATIGLAEYSQPAPAVEPPPDTTTYVIQVGSFRVQRNAQDLADRLKAAGYHPTITAKDDGGDRVLHVVRVGRLKGMAAAERAAEEIGDTERLVASILVPDSRR